MKSLCLGIGLAAVLLSAPTSSISQVPGDYLGQEPPGLTPEIFAPGIVSTEKKELNSVFTPDGKEFYYSLSEDGRYIIMVMRQVNGRWTDAEVAPFSTEYQNVDMCVSSDGQRLFFGSDRPRQGESTPREGFDIWFVTRTDKGWGEPVNLGPRVNAGEHQIYPTVTEDLTLYFQSRREGNIGGSDIYRARWVNGQYATPENLGAAVNSEANEGDVLIAPDESFLIVSTRGLPDSLGRSDLYISFRRPDGGWTKVKNMGKSINSEATEYCPMLSPDGKYLFFTSTRSGNGDIYWVDAKVIDQMRRSY